MSVDDAYEDDRLKNTTSINPIDQFILKYRDCSRFEKAFLRATEGSTDRDRWDLLNLINKFIMYPESKITDFIEAYKLAKDALASARKIDLLSELKDLKQSPERMAELKKAIAERVYPPELSDPLMLNPLYRSVTSPDFINEFEFNGHIAKAMVVYRGEVHPGSTVDEIKESFESDTKEENK